MVQQRLFQMRNGTESVDPRTKNTLQRYRLVGAAADLLEHEILEDEHVFVLCLCAVILPLVQVARQSLEQLACHLNDDQIAKGTDEPPLLFLQLRAVLRPL